MNLKGLKLFSLVFMACSFSQVEKKYGSYKKAVFHLYGFCKPQHVTFIGEALETSYGQQTVPELDGIRPCHAVYYSTPQCQDSDDFHRLSTYMLKHKYTVRILPNQSSALLLFWLDTYDNISLRKYFMKIIY